MTRTCDVEGCDRQHRGRGLCVAHHKRHLVHGDVRADVPVFTPHAGCDVKGCDRTHYGRGYCRLHLRRLKTHGDVLAHVPVRVVRMPLVAGHEFDLDDTGEL